MSKQTTVAPETTETPAASGNLTVDGYAALLASRQRQPLVPETGNTPAQSPQPEVETEVGDEAVTQTTETEQVEGETGETDPQTDQQPEGDQPEDSAQQVGSDQSTRLDDVIAEAIREAGLEPDKAKAVAKMAKRIAKVVDERDAERNKRLELEMAGQQKPTPSQEQPATAQVTTGDPRVAGIDKQIDQIKSALRTIAQNRDGVTTTDPKTGAEVHFSAEDLEGHRVEYEQQLTQLTAEKFVVTREIERETQSQRELAATEAIRSYPWINDNRSEDYQLAVAELRKLGPLAKQLKDHPSFPLFVGRYVRGLRAETSDTHKPAAPVAKSKPASNGTVPPKVVAGATTRAPSSPNAAKLKAAEEEFRASGGSPKAYGKLLSARRMAATAA